MSKPNNQRHHSIRDIYNNLPPVPQPLFGEEAASIEGRIPGDNIRRGAGLGYVTGAIIGGVKGTLEGLAAAEQGESLKIRTSRVLNSGGQVGKKFGGTLAVLGLLYAVADKVVVGSRGKHDTSGTILTGCLTGASYCLGTGYRRAAMGGLLGAVAAGASVVAKRYVNLPI